jgi:CRISPR system Cascade subunit CasB
MSQALIDRLWKLERAELAELRRSLAFEAGTYAPAFRIVESYAMNASSRFKSNMYYLVAGLFALVERPDPKKPAPQIEPRNLGQSVAELFVERQKSKSVEDRFIALLDADAEQVQYRLRQMIALLKDTAKISWTELLQDLSNWNAEEKYVQRKWAKSFYRHVNSVSTTATNPSETPETPKED